VGVGGAGGETLSGKKHRASKKKKRPAKPGNVAHTLILKNERKDRVFFQSPKMAQGRQSMGQGKKEEGGKGGGKVL